MHKLVNGIKVELTELEQAELRDEWERNLAEANRIKYRIERIQNYPTIGDQLDVIWKFLGTLELTGEAKAMYNLIVDLKTKYPKPE